MDASAGMSKGHPTPAFGGSVSEVPSTADPRKVDDSWRYKAAAFAWVPGIKGQVGRGGVKADLDVSVNDMWDILDDDLETGILAAAEARTDGMSAFGEIVYIKLGADESTATPLGPVGASIDFKLTIAELGGSFELAEIALFTGEKNPAMLEGLVGGRYWRAKTDVRLTAAPGSVGGSGSQDWVDGFVGARAFVPLSDKVLLTVRGDMGGFDVGL